MKLGIILRRIQHMIRFKILFIGILIMLLNYSCSEKFATTEMENNFNSEQINDLEKIRDFFENQICGESKLDFGDCFKKIPHDSLYAYGNPFWEQIDFEKQKDLYKNISKSTFNEIWEFCKTTYFKSGKVNRTVCSSNGNYQNYLTELGKKNPKIEKYAERLLSAGDWSTGNIHYQVFSDEKNFDLNNSDIQLILSIHYLTFNDQEKRNEKWNTE